MDNKKLDITLMIKSDELEQKITHNHFQESGSNNYWRSFEELYNDPEFLEAKKNEFGKEVTKDFEVSKLSKISRRKFLALMSASAALAAAGCSNYKDKGEVIPYNKKPEEIILGNPNYYASTCTGCSNTCGILIKTREGRPIKIDGNPDHPVNKGKICAKGQASILNLYDPDRLTDPMLGENKITWQEADDKIINELKSASSAGKEIAIITHSILSPTLKKLLADFQTTYTSAKIYSYEVISESNRINAWLKSYPKTSPKPPSKGEMQAQTEGVPFQSSNQTLPVIKWDKAKVIVALESDFLGNEGNVIEQVRLFSQSRDVIKGSEFNRLYSVEGAATLTGLNADYRMRLRTDAMEEFVMCLLNEFIVKRGISKYSADSIITSHLQKYSLDDFRAKHNLSENVLNHLVEDLIQNSGKGIVTAGTKLPESAHIAVNFLNEILGNSYFLYSKDSAQIELHPLSKKVELDNLILSMSSGTVGAVIHFDTNPVYELPSDYNYAEALKKVPVVITMAEMINETSEASHYTLPINHSFESWGDYKTRTGFYSLQQPVIAPLYNTRQKEAVLLTWLKGNRDVYNDKIYHEYLMSNWESSIFPAMNSSVTFKNFWYSALHDGVVITKEKPEPSPGFQKETFISATGKMIPGTGYVVLLQDNYSVGSGGKFANNGWLQELPHPVSKIVWDNYAAVSVQTAAELNIKSYDVIEIKSDGRAIQCPAFIQPGLADKVIEVQLGYGRKTAGTIGSNIGFNANLLLSKNASLSDRIINNAQISKTGESYELISTQEHHAIDENPLLKDLQFKRHIIQEGTYSEYKKNPKFLQRATEKLESMNEFPSVNKEHKYEQVKWGMVIDLNKCSGCSACIIACNVENNIPVVGKDQVKVNREMQWLRIDRYYSGTPDAPKTSFQPMLCQHCDFAPCENVCPVAATTHTPDGLNGMAYNRCVGTRYCSNNCPYKVRRFNFFNFRDRVADSFYEKEPIELMYNPEVTVRSRGVMEKCTFCIQRTMDERQKANQQNRAIEGSNVKTACQDACPADAIVFGDVNNKENEVAKLRDHDLSYLVLEELKVRPNVTYLAKLRNVEEK
ncbi:MAG: TAT-variant-translocated molybdopterin oxidoreductase [Ignavibacteria bacterium]